MTPTEGHRILDAAREGADVSRADIARALRATGDIDPDTPLQLRTPTGDWEHHMRPALPVSVFTLAWAA